MNEEIDNGQLHDICSRLLKGFINWIEINDSCLLYTSPSPRDRG